MKRSSDGIEDEHYRYTKCQKVDNFDGMSVAQGCSNSKMLQVDGTVDEISNHCDVRSTVSMHSQVMISSAGPSFMIQPAAVHTGQSYLRPDIFSRQVVYSLPNNYPVASLQYPRYQQPELNQYHRLVGWNPSSSSVSQPRPSHFDAQFNIRQQQQVTMQKAGSVSYTSNQVTPGLGFRLHHPVTVTTASQNQYSSGFYPDAMTRHGSSSQVQHVPNQRYLQPQTAVSHVPVSGFMSPSSHAPYLRTALGNCQPNYQTNPSFTSPLLPVRGHSVDPSYPSSDPSSLHRPKSLSVFQQAASWPISQAQPQIKMSSGPNYVYTGQQPSNVHKHQLKSDIGSMTHTVERLLNNASQPHGMLPQSDHRDLSMLSPGQMWAPSERQRSRQGHYDCLTSPNRLSQSNMLSPQHSIGSQKSVQISPRNQRHSSDERPLLQNDISHAMPSQSNMFQNSMHRSSHGSIYAPYQDSNMLVSTAGSSYVAPKQRTGSDGHQQQLQENPLAVVKRGNKHKKHKTPPADISNSVCEQTLQPVQVSRRQRSRESQLREALPPAPEKPHIEDPDDSSYQTWITAHKTWLETSVHQIEQLCLVLKRRKKWLLTKQKTCVEANSRFTDVDSERLESANNEHSQMLVQLTDMRKQLRTHKALVNSSSANNNRTASIQRSTPTEVQNAVQDSVVPPKPYKRQLLAKLKQKSEKPKVVVPAMEKTKEDCKVEKPPLSGDELMNLLKALPPLSLQYPQSVAVPELSSSQMQSEDVILIGNTYGQLSIKDKPVPAKETLLVERPPDKETLSAKQIASGELLQPPNDTKSIATENSFSAIKNLFSTAGGTLNEHLNRVVLPPISDAQTTSGKCKMESKLSESAGEPQASNLPTRMSSPTASNGDLPDKVTSNVGILPSINKAMSHLLSNNCITQPLKHFTDKSALPLATNVDQSSNVSRTPPSEQPTDDVRLAVSASRMSLPDQLTNGEVKMLTVLGEKLQTLPTEKACDEEARPVVMEIVEEGSKHEEDKNENMEVNAVETHVENSSNETPVCKQAADGRLSEPEEGGNDLTGVANCIDRKPGCDEAVDRLSESDQDSHDKTCIDNGIDEKSICKQAADGRTSEPEEGSNDQTCIENCIDRKSGYEQAVDRHSVPGSSDELLVAVEHIKQECSENHVIGDELKQPAAELQKTMPESGVPEDENKDTSATLSVTLTLQTAKNDNVSRVLGAIADLLKIAVPPVFETKSRQGNTENMIKVQSLIAMRPKFCQHCAVVISNLPVMCLPTVTDEAKSTGAEDTNAMFCSHACRTEFYSTYKRMVKTELSESETVAKAESANDEVAIDSNGDSSHSDHHADEQSCVKRCSVVSSSVAVPKKHHMRWSKRMIKDAVYGFRETDGAERAQFSPSLIDNRSCFLCGAVGDGKSDGPGRLLCLDVNQWVHLNCALWSYDVFEAQDGTLFNVEKACRNGQFVTCSVCSRYGATINCFEIGCSKIYHLNCAIDDNALFYSDKTVRCSLHCTRPTFAVVLESLMVDRLVFVDRDECRQLARMLRDEDDRGVLRMGSLVVYEIGQLLPHQMQAGRFSNAHHIYPIGYRSARYYWSFRRLNERCQYVCRIEDVSNRPSFVVTVKEQGLEDVIVRDRSCHEVWQRILQRVAKLRNRRDLVKLHHHLLSGEEMFGLAEPTIIRLIESMPGIELLPNYVCRNGKPSIFVLPLPVNPTGCVRTEPRQRTIYKRSHHPLVNSAQRSTSAITSRTAVPVAVPAVDFSISQYLKQFTLTKLQQFRSLKTEWRSNVYLRRSNVQGLGLFAAKELEKHTMVIEYIGQLIRNEVSEMREKVYDQQNRGIYMFRLNDNFVVDATMAGGPARYINHSCNPNCFTEVVPTEKGDKIVIIAKRKICAGEELSYDYKFDFEDEKHKIPCLCGASNCRKWMN